MAEQGVIVLSNETIEVSVLGTILRYNEYYTQNRDVLNVDFFHNENKNIFSAVKDIIEGGGIATPVTVTAYLEDRKISANRYELQRFVAICDRDTFPANLHKLEEYYKRNMARIYFMQYADESVNMGSPLDDIITRSEKDTKALMSATAADSIVSSSEAMKRIRKHIQGIREGSISRGVMTGYRIFDSNYGLHDHQLIIIAARTGVGKSALAIVAYYSAEMGVNELWARVLSYSMKMPSKDLLYNKLSDIEMDRLEVAAQNYAQFPLYIDEEANVSFDRMMRSIRTMVIKHGVKVIFVDYLQIVRTTKNFDSEALKLAFVSRELKDIAMELHIIVVALSQMNRGGVKEGVTSKFSLRGSGEIEEAADAIVIINRPDADPNTRGSKFEGDFSWVTDTTNKAIFRLDKGRGTGCAEYLMNFQPEYTLFTDDGVNEINTEFMGEDTEPTNRVEAVQSNMPF